MEKFEEYKLEVLNDVPIIDTGENLYNSAPAITQGSPNSTEEPLSSNTVIDTYSNLSQLKSSNFVSGSAGWIIKGDGSVEFSTGVFRGAISASTIDIGGADATSFHVDIDGNLWLGAAIYASGTFKVSSVGVVACMALFTLGSSSDATQQISYDGSGNITVNLTNLTNQDIFGDGSDGDVTISGDTTLSSDMFYNNLTINTTKTLTTAGYRIFVKGTLTTVGTGAIVRNGNNGGNGTNGSDYSSSGTGGAAGAALAAGSLVGSLAGLAGKNGVLGVSQTIAGVTNGNVGTVGSAGVDAEKSLATADGIAGAGTGAAGNATRGGNTGTGGIAKAGGAAGARTGTIYNKIHNAAAAYNLFDVNGGTLALLTSSPSNGGSAGASTGGASAEGGADTAQSGASGGSGGGGSQGGILIIFARKIVNAGTISANGGNGGNAGTTADSSRTGTQSAAGGSSGSGGGNGGNGGIVILVYSNYTNTGTVSSNGGTAGTGAAAGAKVESGGNFTSTAGTAGTNGTAGNTFSVIQLQI